MSLNICPFPYAAQLRLGLEKLKKSSNTISDGTVIKSQCSDQIVVWVITSFFSVPLQCYLGIGSINGLSGCSAAATFHPQGGFVLRVGEPVLAYSLWSGKGAFGMRL